MSVKSAPYYWVECDNCGARCEYGDFTAYAEPSDATTWAIEADWSEQGKRHHCPSCPYISDCGYCGKDAGQEPLERDNLCQACWGSSGATAV